MKLKSIISMLCAAILVVAVAGCGASKPASPCQAWNAHVAAQYASDWKRAVAEAKHVASTFPNQRPSLNIAVAAMNAYLANDKSANDQNSKWDAAAKANCRTPTFTPDYSGLS